MCGVAASLGRPHLTAPLVARLKHRGPDQTGIYLAPLDPAAPSAGPVQAGIGAARLRVKGGAAADMPLVSRTGRTVVAVNGEVFNHRDLFGPGDSDLAGLPDLLERVGPRALDRLRGPFALLALDIREGTLLLARDEVGVRPLFYREEEGWVAAASEVQALRAVAGPCRHDRRTWEHMLAFQFWPRGRTPWREIRSVRPGEWIRFRRAGSVLERDSGTLRFQGGRETLAHALEDAFALQAPCGPKTGITLSGGLDSSAVASLLCEGGRRPDLAAVGWFPGASDAFDERPHARAVASALGIELLEVPITCKRYMDAWPRLLHALGGPLAGPGGPAQWVVADGLRRAGVRVVYSGQGGDELFGGYERHRLLLQRDLGLPLTPAPGYEPLAAAFERDGLPGLLFRGATLLPHLEPASRAAVLQVQHELPPPGPRLADRVLAWERRVLLPGLLAVEDRALSAFGMEGRAPLLDPVLARVAGLIPLERKSPPHAARSLFRRLLGGRLPRQAMGRTDKMGFPVPLADWLRGPMRSMLFDHPGLDRLEEVGFKPGVREALRAGRLPARTVAWLLSVGMTLADERAQALEVSS